jgi:hypothetical protein
MKLPLPTTTLTISLQMGIIELSPIVNPSQSDKKRSTQNTSGVTTKQHKQRVTILPENIYHGINIFVFMSPMVYFDTEFKSMEEEDILLYSKLSRTTLGHIQASVQWVKRFFPGEKSGRSFKFSITSFYWRS